MKQQIWVLYFSPTGGTKKAVLKLAEGMGADVKEMDLMKAKKERSFGPEDVVFVAAPVFGGRIPAMMAERLKDIKGQGSLAVTAVVYGNRAYEDALLELNDCLKEQGFAVAASAALLARHSMAPEVAEGRPDVKDEMALAEFSHQIKGKLEKTRFETAEDVKVPGNRPYREWVKMPMVPQAQEGCTKCGICVEQCPAGAISMESIETADHSKCILCMRCSAVCPSHVRKLPEQARALLSQKLEPVKGIRRENELFL